MGRKKTLQKILIFLVAAIILTGSIWGIKLYLREQDPGWQAAKEIYRVQRALQTVDKFFTWHALTITGEISLQHSIRFAFPEFYFGLCVSLVMVAVYFVITVKVKE